MSRYVANKLLNLLNLCHRRITCKGIKGIKVEALTLIYRIISALFLYRRDHVKVYCSLIKIILF